VGPADWQNTPFTLPLLLSGLLCGWVAYVSWRRRAVPGAAPFAVLMAALSGWDFVNLVEKSLINHELRRAVAPVLYLFIVTVPAAWLVFAARFAGQDRWLPRRLVPLLFLEPLLILTLVFTNPLHGLIYADTRMEVDGPYAIMVITHGLFFYVNAAYNWMLFVAGAALVVAGVIRQPGRSVGRLAVVLGALAVPVLGNAAWVLGLQPRRLTDLTPVYFAVPGLAGAWLLFRVRVFDIRPIARDFVLDCLSDAVFVLDTRDRVLDANRAARSLLPDPGGVRKQPLADVLPELARYLPAPPGGAAATELQLRAAGPERFWDLHALPLIDRGATIGALVRLTDVTERRRAEAELREAESRFRQLAQNIPGVFWMTDARAPQMLFISPAYEDVWGCTCQGLYEAPQSYLEGVHPDDRERVREAARRQLRGESTNEEYRVVRPDGSVRWVWDRGFPIRDQAGQVYRVCGIAVDVTARKQAEEALKEADRRKDEFLAMLAHELRNPLAPIGTALEIMRRTGATVPSVEPARQTIERQFRQLARLVDDLLDVARITRGHVELRKGPAELAAVVGQALETSRPFLDARGHELTVSLPPEPVWLDADPDRLAQVFANLLNNAAKFTPEGGRIELTAERQGRDVVLRVRDNGVGMTGEMLTRAFDLFVQGDRALDRSQAGLGIGLTLARRLVAMHGGSVHAYSDGPGKGAEFVVRLPVRADAPPAGRASRRDDGPRTSRRILVVDDNVDAADALAHFLGMSGHQVRTAYGGPEALEAARAYRPETVFLDIGLPGMDGYEVARQLRREVGLEGIVLVAVTGYGQEEDRRRSHAAAIDHHLVKPVDLAALEAVLAARNPPVG
jgi:two-component system CheB/CheR fusion protein